MGGFLKRALQAIAENGASARDARSGVGVGADQVRQLYKEGRDAEAAKLAKNYAKATTSGIAIAGGAASPTLWGDMAVSAGTTALDAATGQYSDAKGWLRDLALNIAGDLVGKGINKGVEFISPYIKSNYSKMFSKGNWTNTKMDRYYHDGKWDMNTLLSDFKEGRQSAYDLLQHNSFLETGIHNTELANRLGWTKFYNSAPEAFTNASTNMRKPIFNNKNKVWIGNNENGFFLDIMPPTNGELGSVALNSAGRNLDELTININGDISDTAFHEFLHRGDIGSAPHKSINNEYTFDNFKQTGDFLDWKKKHLLKPTHSIYLDDSHEAAVNALEIGRRAGIDIGQQYPGKEAALKIYQNIINNDPIKGNFLKEYRWEDKPKRVWQALSGTYFKNGGTINYLHDNNMIVFKDGKIYIRQKPNFYKVKKTKEAIKLSNSLKEELSKNPIDIN